MNDNMFDFEIKVFEVFMNKVTSCEGYIFKALFIHFLKQDGCNLFFLPSADRMNKFSFLII